MENERVSEIENYLSGTMPEAEKQAFESRLRTDAELSALLSLYRTVELEMKYHEKTDQHQQALQSVLGRLGKEYFTSATNIASEEATPVVQMQGKRRFPKMVAVAASVTLIIAACFIWFARQDPQQLADRYVRNNLAVLSQTMDGAKDSLQQGIAAYNNKKYTEALQIFQELYHADAGNTEALLYAGITRLATGEYEAAIQVFSELSAREQLFSNPGLFLKAVTLLQRDQPGDREQARTILRQVVDENLENAAEAKKMLDSW